jgi:three-Cys-motif partner protein
MLSDFHKVAKAWTQLKHGILRSYLGVFLGKLGRRREPVFYVDGFAGPGMLEDGTKGSPVIAAELAAEPPQASRRGLLHCIHIEADAETFCNLQQATAPFARTGLIHNYHGTFTEMLPCVLQQVGESPTFFFIDPFGTQGAETDTLQAIAARRGTTEVLVRYDDTRVKRLISWAARNADHYDPAHRQTARALKARVDQLTDEQAAAKAEAVLAGGEGVETREWLIEGYVRRVKEGAGFKYSLPYPVRNPETGGHRYYLIHFCNFADGYIYMAHYMAKMERALRKASLGAHSLFEPPQLEFDVLTRELEERKEAQTVQQIAAALPRIMQSRGWTGMRVRNRDIYAAIVDEFKWGVLRGEYVKALRALERQGKLSMQSAEDGDYSTIGTM